MNSPNQGLNPPFTCLDDADSVTTVQIQGLITLNNSSYVPQAWHGTLLVIAVVTCAILINISMAKSLPILEIVVLVIHITGVFAIIITLLVMTPSKNSAQVALLQFYNGGNWTTVGLATMIGLLTPLGTMLGFDCAVHMGTFSILTFF